MRDHEVMTVRVQRLFTADEYEAMFASGILTADDRVELLDGRIVRKPKLKPPHASSVDKLTEIFVLSLARRVIVRVQSTIRLPPRSEPEPDVALLRRVPDFWSVRHPEPDDILLVVEVADSCLRRDREEKVPLYARARVREVWLVDVTAGTVTVHRDPFRGRYRSVVVLGRGETVRPLAFPDLAIEVDDVVPEPH